MSQLTLWVLMSSSGTQFTTAADAWRAVADVIDTATEDLITVERGVPEAWEAGAGAQECLDTITALRGEVDAAYVPCGNIATALEDLGDSIDALRTAAEDIVAEALGQGFSVDQEACVVNADPALEDVPTDPSLDIFGRAAANEARRQRASYLTGQLVEVLERARGLDDATVTTIQTSLPDPETGFTGQCLSLPSRDEVAAMVGRDPQAVNDWWLSLTPTQQDQLIHNYPDLIGWMDGVPCEDRDTANRLSLTNQRQDLEREANELRQTLQELEDANCYDVDLWTITQNRLDQVNTSLAGLAEVEDTLANLGDQGLLLGIDSAGDGKAIIAIGNPDTADNVLTYVPGTGSDLSNIDGSVDRTKTMVDDANALGSGNQTSGILWLGYDAPDELYNAASDDYADAAAEDLSDFQSGLRVTHECPIPSHNVVLGHSYGTTVIGHTATDAGIDADELILIASPGVGVDSADDLGIPADHVWVTTAQYDAIQWVPNWDIALGADPTSGDFGANVFASDPGNPDDETATHSQYWNDGNIARENIAEIIVNGQIP